MSIQSYLKKNIHTIILAIVAIAFILWLFIYSCPDSPLAESFLDAAQYVKNVVTPTTPTYFQDEYTQLQQSPANMDSVMPSEDLGASDAAPFTSTYQSNTASELTPEDLLPPSNPTNFIGGEVLNNKNFLSSGALIGTIGPVNKIPNYQLRSQPQIKQQVVSPWNNSTVQPDPYQRDFEIGAAPSSM